MRNHKTAQRPLSWCAHLGFSPIQINVIQTEAWKEKRVSILKFTIGFEALHDEV